ncbi:hypothetical protein J3459_021551 [Metarhizium acridum]|uniref:uncharacterized protein n=1 Tax=Metarhizium acridum TaxID=92637 RepID=UPI001C6B7F90|nr:hypothetical protein J3459_021551 [Metarhizium acridum]KAG8408813.1 hypothetical protein J3458_019828 [Metarhizium acridum]
MPVIMPAMALDVADVTVLSSVSVPHTHAKTLSYQTTYDGVLQPYYRLIPRCLLGHWPSFINPSIFALRTNQVPYAVPEPCLTESQPQCLSNQRAQYYKMPLRL